MATIPYGYFYHLNGPFCEGQQIPYHSTYHGYPAITEWCNTFTNILYIFVGLWCFRGIAKKDSLTRICSSLTLLTGIGSTMYHASFWYGLSIFDGMSMHYLAVFLGLSLVENIIETTLDNETLAFNIIVPITHISFMIYLLVIIQQKLLLDDDAVGDPVLLSISIGVILISCIIWCILMKTTDYWKLQRDISCQIFLLMGIAFASMAVAYGFHLFDDNDCGPKNVYVFGHGLWHILSAYAVLLLITAISIIRGTSYGYTSTLVWYGPIPSVTLS